MKKLFVMLFAIVFMIGLVSAVAPQENQTDTAGGPGNWFTKGGGLTRAQQFVVGGSGDNTTFHVNQIGLFGNDGGDSGTLNVMISNVNSSGIATGEIIASGTISSASVPDASEWFNVSISSATLTKGTKYAIIVNESSNNTISFLGAIASGDLYPGNRLRNNLGDQSPVGWFVDSSTDLAFEVYGSTTDLSITLDNPGVDATNINTTINFSSTIDPISFNLTNSTLYLYYGNNTALNITTILINNSINASDFLVSNIPPGKFTWDIQACATNATSTVCSFNGINRTLTRGYELNSETHASSVVELSSQTFTMNLTLSAGLTSSTATLYYNNTAHVATKQNVDGNTIYSSTVQAPSVVGTTAVPFEWNISLFDTLGSEVLSVTSGNQDVSVLSIDDCSANSHLILNYSLKDEETLTLLSVNASIEVEAILSSLEDINQRSIYNHTYNNHTAEVCVGSDTLTNSSFRLDVTTKYSAQDHVVEYHHIQAFTLTNETSEQNISLHDLATADSQEFLITFKDESFIPVSGALIDITRKYVGEGVFRSVEVPLTDSNGEALGHFVLSDVIYTIVISKDGSILGTFDNVVAVCENQATGDCKLNLNIFTTSTDADDFISSDEISYAFSFDEAIRRITVGFTSADGSNKEMFLNTTKYDRFGNELVCSDTITSSSGTLTCDIPDSFGNITVISDLYMDGNILTSTTFTIRDDPSDLTSGSKAFLMLMLLMTIPMMLISHPIAFIVGVVLAILFGGMLLITDTGSLFGEVSIIMWVIISGAIIIIKASRRNNG